MSRRSYGREYLGKAWNLWTPCVTIGVNPVMRTRTKCFLYG